MSQGVSKAHHSALLLIHPASAVEQLCNSAAKFSPFWYQHVIMKATITSTSLKQLDFLQQIQLIPMCSQY